MAKDIKLVHDPGEGWVGSFEGLWRPTAPASTEVRLWAVLRDNRNGVSWSWVDVYVQ